MGVIFAISNRKGGTGKTTLSVNLSAEFSTRGYKVLIIDLDTQANSTIGMGIKPDKTLKTIHHLFEEKISDIKEVILETKWQNLFISPANPMFDHSYASQSGYLLKEVFEKDKIKNFFDLIIIDTAPSLDPLLMNALVIADYVLIPFLPHFLSIEGVKSLIRVFFKIAVTQNTALKLLGLVPIMLNLRIHQHARVIELLSKSLGKEKILPGIRTDIKIAEAFEAGKPVRFYAPSSRAVEDFKTLASKILQIL